MENVTLYNKSVSVDIYFIKPYTFTDYKFTTREKFFKDVGQNIKYDDFMVTFQTGSYRFTDGSIGDIWIQTQEDGIPVLIDQLDEETGRQLSNHLFKLWNYNSYTVFYGIMNSKGQFIYCVKNL